MAVKNPDGLKVTADVISPQPPVKANHNQRCEGSIKENGRCKTAPPENQLCRQLEV